MQTVVNLRDFRAPYPSDVVRIDRRSRWGNPFRTEGDWIMWAAVGLGYMADKAGRRLAAIALYRAWMTGGPIPLGARKESGWDMEFDSGKTVSMDRYVSNLALGFSSFFEAPTLPTERPDLEPLRGKRLACWCHPAPCHGDVIAEILG